MALSIGSESADTGLSSAIYTELDRLLAPPLQSAVDQAPEPARPAAQAALDGAREGWRKLAFAIAAGVVRHLLADLEVVGVTVAGTVTVPLDADTGTAAPSAHRHRVQSAPTAAVALVQSNDGRGRVR